MVYANDQWIQMPVRDLYDNTIMLAAINTAKSEYERGLLEIKDFKKEYGDFFSPILADMDWYNKNVTGRVYDEINRLYEAGIDPIRSAEGRSAIRRVINSINIGDINQKKNAAKAAEQYIKSRDALIKTGMFNPEYEKAMLGGQTLETWDGSLGNWSATSASPYLDYEQKYGHLFDKMGYEYDPEESEKHPGMLVSTKNKDRMREILGANRTDLMNDPQYKYDLLILKDKIAKENPQMNKSDVDATAMRAIENEIIERNYKGGMQMVEDPIAKEQRAFENNVALDYIRTENDIRAYRENHKSDDNSDSGNIFRRAEKLADAVIYKPSQRVAGAHTLYVTSDQYYQLIDPVVQASISIAKNKDTGEEKPIYTFKARNLIGSKTIATLGHDGKMRRLKIDDNTDLNTEYKFRGDGNMRAVKTGESKYEYWISGKLYSGNHTITTDDGNNVIWIQVKERDRNYGQKQRK